MSSSPRAVSPVIAIILMVAIVVILAATVSVFALGFTENINKPGPIVGQSTGELVPQDGSDGGIVRLTHIAGDSLDVSKLEIVVEATCVGGKKQARLVNLPDNAVGFGSPDSIEGPDPEIFDSFSPEGGQLDTSADGTLSAGETATFRLKKGGCELNSGNTVTVRVVHTPTNSVVIEQTLTAT